MWKVCSVLFLLFASVVHSETMCIAHQGLHTSVPGNSLLALQAAVDAKVEGIEFDVQHTSDGEPIVMHDPNLKSTAENAPGKVCPLKRKIQSLTLSEIRSNCRLKGGSEIPTLKDALVVLDNYRDFVFIELKDRPTPITKALIEEHYREKPVNLRVISFSPENFKYFLSLRAGTDEFWTKIKFFDLDVAPFGKDEGFGINLFNRTYGWRKGFLRRLKGELSVWTVNRIPRMKFFLKEGVDFITTDRPLECMELKKAPIL